MRSDLFKGISGDFFLKEVHLTPRLRCCFIFIVTSLKFLPYYNIRARRVFQSIQADPKDLDFSGLVGHSLVVPWTGKSLNTNQFLLYDFPQEFHCLREIFPGEPNLSYSHQGSLQTSKVF